MTTCELRKKAAAIIEARGWRQDDYGTLDGPVCVLGALREARFGTVDVRDVDFGGPLDTAKAEMAPKDAKMPGVWLYEWNDMEGRTKEQVIAKLLDGCD